LGRLHRVSGHRIRLDEPGECPGHLVRGAIGGREQVDVIAHAIDDAVCLDGIGARECVPVVLGEHVEHDPDQRPMQFLHYAAAAFAASSVNRDCQAVRTGSGRNRSAHSCRRSGPFTHRRTRPPPHPASTGHRRPAGRSRTLHTTHETGGHSDLLCPPVSAFRTSMPAIAGDRPHRSAAHSPQILPSGLEGVVGARDPGRSHSRERLRGRLLRASLSA
jgi:hypothetical protein